jgi:Leucine-rich repeat (LRR) protein
VWFVLQGMPLEKLILVEAHGVTDLSALRGMPLKVLNLRQTKVKDIRALQGMPLVNLILAPAGGGITDYSPLKGMRLTEFRADTGFRDSDLAFLKGMPIENLVLMQSNVSDLRPLQAMPLKELTIEGSQRITDISPLANMKLAGINLDGLPVNDLSPLRGQPIESALISDIPATDFSVVSTWILSRDFRAENTKFDDLRLLAGKPIKLLNLQNTPVSDLLPLRGMKIRALFLWGTKVTSLHPVADLPDLEGLTIPTEATDVEFLRHLPNLQSLDNHRIAPGGQARPAADFWKAYPKDKEAREKLTPLMEKLRQSLTAAGVKNLKADAFTISPDWNIDADCTGASISNLGLLRGYPVDEIHLSGSGVTSLEPLRDLPIVTLHFNNTGVTDVRPLLQIPTLQYVILGKSVKDVTILREAKNLKFLSYDSINRNGRSLPAQTAAEFWEQQARLAPVIDALHKMGVKDVTAKQAALNKDGLLEIDLGGLPIGDLSPITGFPIASLNLDNTKVADLGPLRGMPLVHLGFRGAPVKDLSPLQGISLKSLTISSCPVSDLSPLKGMPLEELIIGLTDWTKPREGKTNISDLTPLRGMPLVNLSLGGVNDPDLTPLAECHNLKILVLPFPLKARNIEVLRRLSDLQRISSGWPGGDDKMPDAADFWKEYDAQQNGARK